MVTYRELAIDFLGGECRVLVGWRALLLLSHVGQPLAEVVRLVRHYLRVALVQPASEPESERGKRGKRGRGDHVVHEDREESEHPLPASGGQRVGSVMHVGVGVGAGCEVAKGHFVQHALEAAGAAKKSAQEGEGASASDGEEARRKASEKG